MKPDEILAIADKNGFDNFDENAHGWDYRNTSFIGHIIYETDGEEDSNFSLADLATNKSFLEALSKNTDLGNILMTIDFLQRTLIDDLTNNAGKQFWKICSEFIGESK